MQLQPDCPCHKVMLSASLQHSFWSESPLQMMVLVISQENMKCKWIDLTFCSGMLTCLIVKTSTKSGWVLPLFSFGAVAYSPFSEGMEIWHLDQLLLVQKMSSVAFRALQQPLAVCSCFSCILLPTGPATMLCPSLLWYAGSAPTASLNADPAVPLLSTPSFLRGPFFVSYLRAIRSQCPKH